MKIYKNPTLDQKHCNGVIAIGNFDGIHLGHQKVINNAKKKANPKLNNGPAKATIILSNGLMGGSGSLPSFFPSNISIGAI